MTKHSQEYSLWKSGLWVHRSKLGIVDAKRLRASGRVPGNVYGLGRLSESVSISDEMREKLVPHPSFVIDLGLEGEIDKAFVRDGQWEVLRTYISHFDEPLSTFPSRNQNVWPEVLTVEPHETIRKELDPSFSWYVGDESTPYAQPIAMWSSASEEEITQLLRPLVTKGLAQRRPKKANSIEYTGKAGVFLGTPSYVYGRISSPLAIPRVKGRPDGRSLVTVSKRTFEESSTAILSESTEMPLRMALLRECLSDWPEQTTAFVIQQLHRVDLPRTLLRMMISASDDLRFEPTDREAIAKSLFRHALDLRNSTSLEDREAVWTAIQRGGSLISEASAEKLMPFLDAPKLIDTRLVAIQSLVRIFEGCQAKKAHEVITNRAFELAHFLFHPDVFTAGEISAIAIEATILCTILGDSRVTLLMDAAKRLGRKWVVSAIGQRTQEAATSLS